MKKQKRALLTLYFNIGIGFLLASLSGCATPTVSKPVRLPLKNESNAVAAVSTAQRGIQSVEGLDTEEAVQPDKKEALRADGFETLVYNGSQAPVVKTTPFEATIISLEPGEKFTQVSSGDPSRWSYTVAISGSGANEQQHILVKPAIADANTNLVITTDRRLYTLRLVSSENSAATHRVQFTYSDTSTTETLYPSVADDPLRSLHFNYHISKHWLAPNPIWRPVRVFDDGTHTYIEFSAMVRQHDLPAFFVLDEDHHFLLANYRSRPPYFIVDTLFKRGLLVMNVGNRQSKVFLTRRG